MCAPYILERVCCKVQIINRQFFESYHMLANKIWLHFSTDSVMFQ